MRLGLIERSVLYAFGGGEVVLCEFSVAFLKEGGEGMRDPMTVVHP